jgi:hypothetical protein
MEHDHLGVDARALLLRLPHNRNATVHTRQPTHAAD